MRRAGGSTLAGGIAAMLALALALAPGSAPALGARSASSVTTRARVGAPGPALQLVSQRPRVSLRGIRFVSRETVEVAVIGASVVTGRASAAADGSFRIALRRPAPLACGRLLVRATGVLGSRAFLRIGPPECNLPGADAQGGNR